LLKKKWDGFRFRKEYKRRSVFTIPAGLEKIKQHHIFSCPLHMCHLSFSNQENIYKNKNKNKRRLKNTIKQVCEPLNVIH
jgi:hypothetical protein